MLRFQEEELIVISLLYNFNIPSNESPLPFGSPKLIMLLETSIVAAAFAPACPMIKSPVLPRDRLLLVTVIEYNAVELLANIIPAVRGVVAVRLSISSSVSLVLSIQ